ncbi:MAG TPA: hypothetical protein VN840_13060 [Streptosporangiaceae bacterium]|nr:hypothetical protein [Streptosporangiaceae bacterium]
MSRTPEFSPDAVAADSTHIPNPPASLFRTCPLLVHYYGPMYVAGIRTQVRRRAAAY